MPLPKPMVWIVYDNIGLANPELFIDLVKSIYSFSKEDLVTLRIEDTSTNTIYEPDYFSYNVSSIPAILGLDVSTIAEYTPADISLKNRVVVETGFGACLRYKNARVYCLRRVSGPPNRASVASYPFIVAAEEELRYRDYSFIVYGDLLYLYILGFIYESAKNNENLVMEIEVCDKNNLANCETLTKNIFINEHKNFESEVFRLDRDALLCSASVVIGTSGYYISELSYGAPCIELKPVNFGGGYSNVIEKNERYTVEVPAPSIKLIELRDYLRTFRRL
jgi:hypothetical protein